MPLPNPLIAKAFIETYLSIRKTTWGMDPSDPSKLKDESGVSKLQVCTEYLKKIDDAKTIADWINLIIDMSGTARDIDEKERGRRRGVLGTFVQMAADQPLLLETLLAILSYARKELKNIVNDQDSISKEFDAAINKRIARKNLLEKDIAASSNKHDKTLESESTIKTKQKELDALIDELAFLGHFPSIMNRAVRVNRNDDVHELNTSLSLPSFLALDMDIRYFDNQIKLRESEATRLGEKSLSDFFANVIKGNRTLVVSQILLDAKNKGAVADPKNKPAEPAASKASPTSTVIAVTAAAPKPVDPPKPLVTERVPSFAEVAAARPKQDSAAPKPTFYPKPQDTSSKEMVTDYNFDELGDDPLPLTNVNTMFTGTRSSNKKLDDDSQQNQSRYNMRRKRQT